MNVRGVAVVAVAGAIAAGSTLAVRVSRAGATERPGGRPYVSSLPDPGSRMTRFLASGDGQFYAALAIDPSLSEPEAFSSRPEAAYRAQRPMLTVLAWVASLGKPRRVGMALVVLVAISAGFAAGACALLSMRRPGSPVVGAAILLMPGSLAVISGLGSELLALGFAAAGLIAWERRRTWLSSILFLLAAFSRETLLLVPATLLIVELIRHRRVRSLPLALPFVCWGAWLLGVRTRVGVWPGSHDRIAAPFVGLARAIPHWDDVAPNLIVIALGVAIVVALAIRRRKDVIGIVALAHVSLALIAGSDVWHSWENFGRPLLPLYALGIVSLASPGPEAVQAVAGSDG